MIAEKHSGTCLRRFRALGRWIAIGLFWPLGLCAQFYDYEIVHYFHTDRLGQSPYGRLLEGGDGFLYGIASGGGPGASGVVYSINPSTSQYSVLYRFLLGQGPDSPRAEPILASDGFLYGTTFSGSESSGGIFRMKRDGTSYQTIWTPTQADDGVSLFSPLIENEHGVLLGTAWGGGRFQSGCVFRMNRDGSEQRNIWDFGSQAADGKHPQAGLLEGESGILYGTTTEGGKYGKGTVFALKPDGANYSILHEFRGVDGATPLARLARGRDGTIYGTSAMGGTWNSGTLFRLRPDTGECSVVYEFRGPPDDGKFPNSVLEASDGFLYGTCSQGGHAEHYGTIFKIDRDGRRYTQLRSFFHGYLPNGQVEGTYPNEGLIQTSDGALYGICSGTAAIFRFYINGMPKVTGTLPEVTGAFGVPVSLRLPSELFFDPDPGQSLEISATGAPPGIVFDSNSRAFHGVPTSTGLFHVKVTATDNHPSPRSISTSFGWGIAPVLRILGVEFSGEYRHVARFQVIPAGRYKFQKATRANLPNFWASAMTASTDETGMLTLTNSSSDPNSSFYRAVLP